MALKGYHSYRGRQGALRWLLVIVLLLVLIAACAFLFLQRYITYSDDGSFYLDLPFEINWELPFLSGEEDPGKVDVEPEQDFNLIVDPPKEDDSESEQTHPDRQDPEEPDPEQQETPVPEQERPVPYVERRLIGLDTMPQDEAALIQLLAAEGVDGFVFLAKDREGSVFYQSAVANANAVSGESVSRELLTVLCAQEGVYTVARLSCMRDPVYGRANMAEAGVCQPNGYIWYENDRGGHWLDAEKEAARRYLIDFAVECAQLGFDELLLENVCYPYRGNLYKIDYSGNSMSKTDALALFLNELRSALEPYGVRISLLLEENTVRGMAENTSDTGFIPQQLLPLVDAVYVSTADAETVRQEMGLILNGENVPVLVPVVSEATEGRSWYLLP